MKRKLGTTFVLIVLVVSVLWSSPAAARPLTAAAACSGETIFVADDRLPMCGTTVIIGDSSRVLRLSVPSTVVLPGDWAGDGKVAEIAGTGAFSGFVLVEDLPTGPGETVLMLGLLPPDAFPTHPEARYTTFPPPPDGYVIPQGNYLLYLVADGSPVRLTFRMPDFTGSATYHPTQAVETTIERLSPYLSTGPTGIYSAGTTNTLRSEGMLFHAQWLTAQVHTETAFGSCVYEGPPPGGDEAFLPGCPGAAILQNIFLSDETIDGAEYGQYGYVLVNDRVPPEDREPRPFGVGGFTVTAAAPTTYDAVGLWLSYRFDTEIPTALRMTRVETNDSTSDSARLPLLGILALSIAAYWHRRRT